MASDIITSLELDKTMDCSKIIVIKEINSCDSSFIASCVLGHCIRNKLATVVICTHNSLQHYHNVGLKMNYNLQKAVESGLIDFYDAGQDLVSNVLGKVNNSVEDFWQKIQQKIKKIIEVNGAVNVIFEGVSHLFDMKFTLREVNKICRNLIDLNRSIDNSFLVFHCNMANEEDVTNVLVNSLAHKAHIVGEVENLPSGLSADVSGHLTLKYLSQKYENEHMYTLEPKSSQYLFRLFDRGVKLLAPGTV